MTKKAMIRCMVKFQLVQRSHLLSLEPAVSAQLILIQTTSSESRNGYRIVPHQPCMLTVIASSSAAVSTSAENIASTTSAVAFTTSVAAAASSSASSSTSTSGSKCGASGPLWREINYQFADRKLMAEHHLIETSLVAAFRRISRPTLINIAVQNNIPRPLKRAGQDQSQVLPSPAASLLRRVAAVTTTELMVLIPQQYPMLTPDVRGTSRLGPSS